MALYYYYAMFTISVVLVLVYTFIFHKHFDANLTIIAVLVPVLNVSFLMMARSSNIEEALVSLRVSYIGGCFLFVAAMFLIFNICHVRLRRWMRFGIILISFVVYASALTIGYNDLFYVGMPTLGQAFGASYITNKHYGPMHTVFYVMVICYYVLTIGVIIYAIFRKKQMSRLILGLVILSVTVAMIGFFGGRFFQQKVELLPASYNLGLIIYIILASRLRLYDASDSVTDALVEKGDTGFISFDSKMRYLGSNETAKRMFTELNSYIVDRSVAQDEWARTKLLPWVEEFKRNPNDDHRLIERNDAIYLLRLNYLSVGRFRRGFQFLITDDTANQEHIRLIHSYNAQLEKEVAKKTAGILEMQNKLVLGMATMVEGRDNSTGGHIKRTSDCVRILIEEMKKDNLPELTEQFCHNIIRAAPMHDLGKITIDDAILRKPGKFTPEEYEVMKTHAAEGARIIHQILEGTDDIAFKEMAENVAHYHHEKWDGTGYPKGLKAEEIPFEARIMAVADVYDALVSKRVYKERMSFETAKKIILESMGKHFDPMMEKYYLAAREKLEAYYLENDQ